MAVHITLKQVPHLNKDGSLSKTKKDWQVWVRERSGRKHKIFEGSTKAGAESAERNFRDEKSSLHLANNPNDQHYKNKHRIS